MLSRTHPLAGAFFALLIGGAVDAGTICGTVRDVSTGGPIANAGVFVRTPAGAYTGLYGATDAAGSFCIGSVPIGTYDLEVRVDDYQVGYVRNVVITSTTDVTIPASRSPVALAPPSPNPARDLVTFRFVLTAPARVRLVVSDVHGRLMHGWEAGSLDIGEHRVEWSMRGPNGREAPPGLYFVRLVAGPVERVRAFVRVP